jgi:peroxiredoxin
MLTFGSWRFCGVSADSVARLNQFFAESRILRRKVSGSLRRESEIAKLTTTAIKPGQPDVRGVTIDHDFIERETFVIGKDHKIIATFSSNEDKLSPDAHVEKSLAIVQQLSSK